MVSVSPHLWFDNNAAEAVAFYLSVFPDSEVVNGRRAGQRDESDIESDTGAAYDDDSMQVIDFRIGDLNLSAFNGGPHHEFNDSISLAIICDTQRDVDAVWDKLTGIDGTPLSCGWVRDRFGVSWQIIPSGLNELLSHPDPGKAKRALGALLEMKKIVLADIETAMNEI